MSASTVLLSICSVRVESVFAMTHADIKFTYVKSDGEETLSEEEGDKKRRKTSPHSSTRKEDNQSSEYDSEKTVDDDDPVPAKKPSDKMQVDKPLLSQPKPVVAPPKPTVTPPKPTADAESSSEDSQDLMPWKSKKYQAKKAAEKAKVRSRAVVFSRTQREEEEAAAKERAAKLAEDPYYTSADEDCDFVNLKPSFLRRKAAEKVRQAFERITDLAGRTRSRREGESRGQAGRQASGRRGIELGRLERPHPQEEEAQDGRRRLILRGAG